MARPPGDRRRIERQIEEFPGGRRALERGQARFQPVLDLLLDLVDERADLDALGRLQFPERREDLGDGYFATVKRYDGLTDSKGKPKAGVPKLVVVKAGQKGKEYSAKGLPGAPARALAKAIVKLDKAGAFGG